MQPITQLPSPPARPKDAHKGTFGTVMVVGGSLWMPGAPALAARAALRSGAGLVKFAAEPVVLSSLLLLEASATGVPLPEAPANLDWLETADPQGRAVLAVGPGLGTEAVTVERVRALMAVSRPLVLDADGLNALAALLKAGADFPVSAAPRVLSPHPGEFARLAEAVGIEATPGRDPAARQRAAAALARRLSAVVLLKGAGTVVSDGERFYCNDTGNAALATAGSGDVLTGLIAGLMAQGLGAWEAAVLGAWLHGLAADHWAHRFGHAGLIARELADGIPGALEECRRLHRPGA